MADDGTRKGHCLCGAVTFRVSEGTSEVAACHCSMCRRWSGGPLMVLDASGDVAFTGEESIGVYKSSEWGERGFCSKCGTNLFWRMADRSHYVVSVGALEDMDGLVLSHEIFVDEKPSFYDFANDTKKMTGEEVFAAFSGGESKD